MGMTGKASRTWSCSSRTQNHRSISIEQHRYACCTRLNERFNAAGGSCRIWCAQRTNDLDKVFRSADADALDHVFAYIFLAYGDRLWLRPEQRLGLWPRREGKGRLRSACCSKVPVPALLSHLGYPDPHRQRPPGPRGAASTYSVPSPTRMVSTPKGCDTDDSPQHQPCMHGEHPGQHPSPPAPLAGLD